MVFPGVMGSGAQGMWGAKDGCPEEWGGHGNWGLEVGKSQGMGVWGMWVHMLGAFQGWSPVGTWSPGILGHGMWVPGLGVQGTKRGLSGVGAVREEGAKGWDQGNGDPGQGKSGDGVPEWRDQGNGGPMVGLPEEWGSQGWAVAGWARGSQLLHGVPQILG